MMRDRRQQLARAIATTGGLGDLLPAPGTTAGSLPAGLAWWVACALMPADGVRLTITAAALALATTVGIWAAGVEAVRRGAGDPGPVVIDEVAGQWLTYVLALIFVPMSGLVSLSTAALVGFAAFRFFDILKPWPVSALERLPGGVGIMVDDLAAAVYAGVTTALVLRLFA
jgi:phosphatidylglycerophosphatase A